MTKVLSENDLKTYLSIKAGKLSPEAVTTIETFTKKYIDRLSKMTNEVRKTNLNVLLVSIDKYTNDLVNTSNVKSLQFKLYILQLLKFNVQKEIYLLNLPTDTAINLEYNCSDSEKLTLQIV
ncbi:MAG: hypothetical protein LBC61_03255 [Candidatus Peribacteria bacterium]|jgi:hypothetical protein|nr:hypothetical protein [Candidatus Peribacteria bacterium]